MAQEENGFYLVVAEGLRGGVVRTAGTALAFL
jgi:hypothetical protein